MPGEVFVDGGDGKNEAVDLDVFFVGGRGFGEFVCEEEFGFFSWPADVVPWRVSDFEGRAAHVVASLPAVVCREGKLLYDADAVAA